MKFIETLTIEPKTVVGKKMKIQLNSPEIAGLWGSFMPLRHSIPHRLNDDLLSIVFYPDQTDIDSDTLVTRWAAVEVEETDKFPDQLQSMVIPGGFYGKFLYKGLPSDAAKAFNYLFTEWLPASGYQLDSRPHFEVLGRKYRHNDPDSEEEIWIPLQKGE